MQAAMPGMSAGHPARRPGRRMGDVRPEGGQARLMDVCGSSGTASPRDGEAGMSASNWGMHPGKCVTGLHPKRSAAQGTSAGHPAHETGSVG
jgi:hypothetical protein